MAADRWDEQVGSVADEAARLLESLLRASPEDAGARDVDDARHDPEHGAPAPGPGTDAGHDPFCQWCPLCRSAAVVRSLSPETLSRLADLAVVASGVLADLAARGGPTAPPPDTAQGSGPEGRGAERPSRRSPSAPPHSRPVPVVDIDEEGPHA